MMAAVTTKQRNYTGFILISIILVGLLYLLSPILLPFVAAAIIAYICNPLVNRLIRLPMQRLMAVVIVFSAVFLTVSFFIFFLIPDLIQKQLYTLSVQLPNMLVYVQTKMIPWVDMHLNLMGDNDVAMLKSVLTENVSKAGRIFQWLLATFLSSGRAVFELLMNMILIPVVTFYLLRDWESILDNIRSILPAQSKATVVSIAQQCNAVLSAFFRGQLIIMLILTIFYAISLSLVGLQLGAFIGFIVGLLSIVPYLGVIIGLSIAVIAALVQFGTLSAVLWVTLIFLIGHIFENFYLTPKLIGDRIGLHPVAVIFSVLAGGCLFGFFGVLLALPAAAVIFVLLKHLPWLKRARQRAPAST